MSSFARHWSFGSPLTGFALNARQDWMAFALADGTLRLLPAFDEPNQPTTLSLFDTPFVLGPDADDHAFLAGGADGRTLLIEPGLEAPTEIANVKEPIAAIAGSSSGQRALLCGDRILLLSPSGKEQARLTLPARGTEMGFSPNGKRLAALHEKGVSLFWVNVKKPQAEILPTPTPPHALLWHPTNKGLCVALKDGRAMGFPLGEEPQILTQEPPSPCLSLAFSANEAHLVASGGAQITVWPLSDQNPAAQRLSRPAGPKITHVAPHPFDPFVAGAYENGAIIFAPFDGRVEATILPATGKKLVDLVWNKAGDILFAPLEEGALLLFTSKSIAAR
jgi:hypothetical protein